jgi:hypothetical protein
MLAAYAYTYDFDYVTDTWAMLGQRTAQVADLPALGLAGAITKYYYDAGYRLIRVDYPNEAPFGGERHAWTYDLIGNRLTNTVNGVSQTYTYQRIGANPYNWQRLMSDGDSSYTYDANGTL